MTRPLPRSRARCRPWHIGPTAAWPTLTPNWARNLLVVFTADGADIGRIPNLDRLIPGLDALLARLQAADANQYCIFRFDPAGTIRAAFVFLRMDDHLSAVPADVLALAQAVQTILLRSDGAFHDRSALADAGAGVILRPEIGALIRAAYDPVLPAMATDPAHALRLYARLARAGIT